jgi:hypothetical protein
MSSVKKYTICITIILILGIAVIARKSRLWLPYYNYYFTKYDYLNPQHSEEFIVGTEGNNCGNFSAPIFIKNVISVAFPDKKIVYRNDI